MNFSCTDIKIHRRISDATEALITTLLLIPGLFLAWYLIWNVIIVRKYLEDRRDGCPWCVITAYS